MAKLKSKMPYAIARWNEDTETWKPLAKYSTYERADEALDKWVNRYPYAWIEILEPSGEVA